MLPTDVQIQPIDIHHRLVSQTTKHKLYPLPKPVVSFKSQVLGVGVVSKFREAGQATGLSWIRRIGARGPGSAGGETGKAGGRMTGAAAPLSAGGRTKLAGRRTTGAAAPLCAGGKGSVVLEGNWTEAE